jgi:hypothetical protein
MIAGHTYGEFITSLTLGLLVGIGIVLLGRRG